MDGIKRFKDQFRIDGGFTDKASKNSQGRDVFYTCVMIFRKNQAGGAQNF